MTILVTFALVFVVIYLYYTINDVRKMSVELKKVTQDVQTLSTSFAKLSNDLVEVQKMGIDVNKMFSMNDMLTQELNGLLSQQMPAKLASECVATAVSNEVCNANGVCVKTTSTVEQAAIEDDNESVDTADIKKILNDDDESPEEEPVPEVVAPPPEPTKPVAKKAAPKKKTT
jgi:hypothetical protein